MLGLDLLEQQHVSDANHRREGEACIGQQERRDVKPEERPSQHARSFLSAGPSDVEGRDDLERDRQRQDERAHRPLVGCHFRVEVREHQHPDERGDGRRPSRDGHVPHVHSLHADDEGVGQGARDEQRGRRPADRRRPPGEVPDVSQEGH